jgi:hypothetical protein
MSIPCGGISSNTDVVGIGVRIRPHLTSASFTKRRQLFYPGAHQLLCHYSTPRPCPGTTRDPRDLGGFILRCILLCRPCWPWPPRDSCHFSMPYSSFTFSSSLASVLLLWVSAQECRAHFLSQLNVLMRVGKNKWTMARFIIGAIAQLITIIAFTGWGLYVWVNVKDYGSQNQCNNEVKYVLMFVSIRATKPWLRVLWIVVLVASAAGLLLRYGLKLFFGLVLRDVGKTDKGKGGGRGGDEGSEGEEGERRDGGWYIKVSIVPLLYVISLSSASNAHH